MEDLRIGVIGVWGRGRLALHAHKPGKGSRIIAGADINPESLEHFQKEIGEKVFVTSDYRELLKREDIDAVFITTPDFLHEEQAFAALEAGKAVFLEKPMSITIESCDRLLETAYRTGTILYMGHNMRYFPVVLKMKEIIESGVIGNIQTVWCRHFISYGGDAYFKDWHSERRYSNGLLLQKGAHDIDVIHWLCDSCTERVVGMGRLSVYDKCKRREEENHSYRVWENTKFMPEEQTNLSPLIDIEDSNMIMMQLSNGVQASYTQCHYTPDSERNYTFIGTHGRMENIGDCRNIEIHVWTRRGLRAEPDIVYKLKSPPDPHAGSDPLTVDAFIDFITRGIKPNTSPVAARDAVAVGFLGHESMRNGNIPKDIPALPQYLIEYFANGQKK